VSQLKSDMDQNHKTAQEANRTQSTQFAIEKSELETKQVALDEELKAAKKDNQSLTQQIQQLKESGVNSDKQRQSELDGLNEKLVALGKDKEALVKEKESLMKEKESLTKEKETLVKEKESLKSENAKLLDDKQSLEDKVIRDSTVRPLVGDEKLFGGLKLCLQ